MAPRDKILMLAAVVTIVLIIGVLLITIMPRETSPGQNMTTNSSAINNSTIDSIGNLSAGNSSLTHTSGNSSTGNSSFIAAENGGTGWYNLSGEQRNKTKAILFNMTPIMDPQYPVGLPEDYKVGKIDVGPVHEIARDINRVRYLPYVELITGNESFSGINVVYYVDLDREQIVYQGYTFRNVPDDHTHYYTATDYGVRGTTVERSVYQSTEEFINVTIMDSPYLPGFYDSDKIKLLEVADKDERVRGYLNGEKYNVKWYLQWDWGQSDGHSYRELTPILYIRPVKADGSERHWQLAVTFYGFGNGISNIYKCADIYPGPGVAVEMPDD